MVWRILGQAQANLGHIALFRGFPQIAPQCLQDLRFKALDPVIEGVQMGQPLFQRKGCTALKVLFLHQKSIHTVFSSGVCTLLVYHLFMNISHIV